MAQADRALGHRERHLRLDVTAGEDRSRVRHPTSVLNLVMVRRAVLTLAVRWIPPCRHRRHAVGRRLRREARGEGQSAP